MQTTAFPTAAPADASTIFAIDFGRRASAALFALAAVGIFIFGLQSSPLPNYNTSVLLRMLPPEGPAAQPQFHVVEQGSLIDRWQPYIEEASHRFAIPQEWIKAVMRAESGGRTMLAGQPITSKAGAAGLMQLMKDTYGEMRQRYQLGANVHDPRDNILAGTAYLQQMRERYGYPNLFAAYNAGPRRLDEHLQKGKSLPRETRNYLGLVVQLINFTAAGQTKTAKNG